MKTELITPNEMLEKLRKGEDSAFAQQSVIDLPKAVLMEFVNPEDAWANTIRAKYTPEVIRSLKQQLMRKGYLMISWDCGKQKLKITEHGKDSLKK